MCLDENVLVVSAQIRCTPELGRRITIETVPNCWLCESYRGGNFNLQIE